LILRDLQKAPDLNTLQQMVVSELLLLFNSDRINSFFARINENVGVRGDYDGKLNLQLEVRFFYNSFLVEYYLSYDQLEFYLYTSDGKKIDECVLEDFYVPSIHASKFIEYLKKSLSQNQVLNND
jgi:hypothetical protein